MLPGQPYAFTFSTPGLAAPDAPPAGSLSLDGEPAPGVAVAAEAVGTGVYRLRVTLPADARPGATAEVLVSYALAGVPALDLAARETVRAAGVSAAAAASLTANEDLGIRRHRNGDREVERHSPAILQGLAGVEAVRAERAAHGMFVPVTWPGER